MSMLINIGCVTVYADGDNYMGNVFKQKTGCCSIWVIIFVEMQLPYLVNIYRVVEYGLKFINPHILLQPRQLPFINYYL